MAIEIKLPSVAAGMDEATLVRWTKTEGDNVTKGDILAELETDKAVLELEAETDGVLGRILVPDNTDGVQVGTVIGVLQEPGEDKASLANYVAADSATSSPALVDEPEPETVPMPSSSMPGSSETGPSAQDRVGRIFASPLARRLAIEHGVALATLKGSGPYGRIVKLDVERAQVFDQPHTEAAATGGAPTATAPSISTPVQKDRVESIPNSGMRKTIARRLTESKQQVPHFYLAVDCHVDELLELRSRLNAKGAIAEPSYRLSVNDFVVYSVAKALRRVPEVNASWTAEAILKYQDVDISVAVATEGGLITPVIRDADRKGLAEISSEIRELARKAQDGKLDPSEYQGGGFTISNLGMYGIKEFSAIINPPQAAILAVGTVEKRPVVKDDQLAVGNVMTITLSADHRVVDGAMGARYLTELRSLLEDPLNLLV